MQLPSSKLNALLSLLAVSVAAAPTPITASKRAASGTVMVTPHDMYSSSVGVLGCKINSNRVAYWPGSVGCNDICVELTYNGRKEKVLRVDQSGGAHDISYDAFVQLVTGKSAKQNPIQSGPVQMSYRNVAASECAGLLDGGKVPLTAANSMNYLVQCLNEPNSYVAKNHVLYNIINPTCTFGVNERCTLNLKVSNQPSCPSGLGNMKKYPSPVVNIIYGTGKEVPAQ